MSEEKKPVRGAGSKNTCKILSLGFSGGNEWFLREIFD